MSDLPLYNFAAVPADAIYTEKLTAFARHGFALHAKDYLLGPEALPHMTICFFRAADDEMARAISEAVPSQLKQPFTVATDALYTRPHQDAQDQTIISTGLTVIKTRQMMDMQDQICASIIAQGGVMNRCNSDTWWPHFTCAFVDDMYAVNKDMLQPWAFGNIPIRPALGRSDAAGQFLYEIKLAGL